LLLTGDRQRENEGVCVDATARKLQLAGERYRKHEDIDQEQVERKHPLGSADVALVAVFDHPDLELAGEEHDCHRREESQREPAVVSADAFFQHGLEVACGGRLFKDVGKPIVETVCDEDPDGGECGELDHRFQRNGGDHPLMALAGIEMPGAEENREHRQEHRYIEGVVVPER